MSGNHSETHDIKMSDSEMPDIGMPPRFQLTRTCSKYYQCLHGNCGSTRCHHVNKTCDGYTRCSGPEPCTSTRCHMKGFTPPALISNMSMKDAFATIVKNKKIEEGN